MADELIIHLQPGLLQRLLSASPPLDVDKLCSTALEEALDKRTKMEQPLRLQGRPAPAVPKVKKSINLDTQVWAALEALRRKNSAESLSAALNALLRKVLVLDGD